MFINFLLQMGKYFSWEREFVLPWTENLYVIAEELDGLPNISPFKNTAKKRIPQNIP